MATSRYIVSAIKYRPHTFAEVLAQDHITRTLLHSLKRKRIANAFLFSGPRGTGKTTLARILAKALNCDNPHEGEPCNQCDPCRMITAGNHPDILEIDAASNTGVDHIRELRENARFTPSMSRYKIYIIDECHMLSKSANNALLKILEEPPEHCRFIFATTELDKILPTILSRCQRFPFRRIPSNIIVNHLKNILSQQEGIEVAEPEELDRILYLLARTSEGCLRDALYALDQLIAFCSGKLELAEVEEVMGTIEYERLDQYIRALIHENLPVLLQLIDTITNQGKEIALFLSECLQFLRNLAVIKVAPGNLELLDLPDEYKQRLVETASLTSIEQILYITDQLWDAEQRIRNSSLGRIILEMASIKAAKAGQAVKIEDLLKKISSADQERDSLSLTVHSPAPSLSPQATPEEPKQGQEPEDHRTKKEEETRTLPEADSAPQPAPNEPVESPPIQKNDLLNTTWKQFKKELEATDPMLAGALVGSVAVDMADDILRIAIPSQGAFGLRTLEKPQNQSKISDLIHKSFGKKFQLRFEKRSDLIQETVPEPAPQTAHPVVSRGELMEKVQKNKIFCKLIEELPGRVVDIKPTSS